MDIHPKAFNESSNGGLKISGHNILITGGHFTDVKWGKNGLEILKDAAIPAAMHDSGELFNPPKCHPNTRTAVLREIMGWIIRQDADTQSSLIMWLHGAAGAGKSAIARTLAEMCVEKGYLIGSFFFSRSDSRRNHALSLFPTIAYQMALVLPEIQPKIFSIIERDPLICARSLLTQFSSLIIEPLRDISNSFPKNTLSPRLIIIDGLDECLDRQVQCQILNIIVEGIRQHNLPLIFLVTSRPEHDISHRFNSLDMRRILTPLPLYGSLKADKDIRRFLIDKFSEIERTHPFKGSIPTPWPTDDVISHLIAKSSGQFIYASTVLKYVQSSRRRPHHQLEIILNLRPARGDRPFAELDSLYSHIFSSVDDIGQVLSFIAIDVFFAQSSRDYTVCHIEHLMLMEYGDAEVLFCDLSSIIELQRGRRKGQRLRFLHASLFDFLSDECRSGPYYIDPTMVPTRLVQHCLQFLTYKPIYDHSLTEITCAAIENFLEIFQSSFLSSDLQRDILSFSIPRIYDEAITSPLPADGLHVHSYFTLKFIPEFFRGLKALGQDAEHLYTHHMQSFDSIIRDNLKVYYSNMYLNFALTMVRTGTIAPLDQTVPSSFREESFNIDDRRLRLLSSATYPGYLTEYGELIHDFLVDPTRSGPHTYVRQREVCNPRGTSQEILGQYAGG